MHRFHLAYMRTAVVATLILLCPLLHAKDARKKQPWEWTDQERLALRNDPAARAARILRLSNRESVQLATPAGVSDILDGSDSPEAFLPIEVYRGMVAQAYLAGARGHSIAQQRWDVAIRQFADPAAFWALLDSLTAEYARRHAQAMALNAQAARTTDLTRQRELQSSSRDVQRPMESILEGGLTALYDHFGRERVNQFLYSEVCPSLHITFLRDNVEGAER